MNLPVVILQGGDAAFSPPASGNTFRRSNGRGQRGDVGDLEFNGGLADTGIVVNT